MSMVYVSMCGVFTGKGHVVRMCAGYEPLEVNHEGVKDGIRHTSTGL